MASTVNKANSSIVELVQRLSIQTGTEKILWIVDDVVGGNLKNLKDLRQNITKSSKMLIITQMSCDFPNTKSVDFPEFTYEESKEFLRTNLKKSKPEEEIKNLSSALNAFPLCLQQAVSYINKHGTEITPYIDVFKKCKEAILDPKREMSDYDKTLLTVWSLAFEKLKTSPKALQVLTMMSLMDNSCINKETFLYDKKIAEDVFDLNEIIEMLCEYSLVEINEDRLYIHGLVQKVVAIKIQLEQFNPRKALKHLLEDIITDSSSTDLHNVDEKNLWYNHYLKLYSIQEKDESFLYKEMSIMASKRSDNENYVIIMKKIFKQYIELYRELKIKDWFLKAVRIFENILIYKTTNLNDDKIRI